MGWNRIVPAISSVVNMEFERSGGYAMPIGIHTGGHFILILPFSSKQSINQAKQKTTFDAIAKITTPNLFYAAHYHPYHKLYFFPPKTA